MRPCTSHLARRQAFFGRWMATAITIATLVCCRAQLGVRAEPPTAAPSQAGDPATPLPTDHGYRVLLDPPPLPSSGSGVEAPEQPAQWAELTDYQPGPTVPLQQSDPVVQGEGDEATATRVTPPVSIIFDGKIDAPVTVAPPDTNIAVGPGAGAAGKIVEVTNAGVLIKDKTGAVVAGPITLAAMFGPGAAAFDPKVLYDQWSGKFFIVVLRGTTPATSAISLAISTTSAPVTLGAADWKFTTGAASHVIGGVATWSDYPGIGADASRLVITTNQFSAANVFTGSTIRVFKKADLLLAVPVYTFADITYSAAVTPGVATIQPAHTFTATPGGAFPLVNRVTGATYRYHAVTGVPPAATVVCFTGLFAWAAGAIPPTASPQCPGSPTGIDNLATRVQNAVWQSGHLYCCMTADPVGGGAGPAKVVWQDIPTAGATLCAAPGAIVNAGFIAYAAGDWTYQPSITVDSADSLAIVFTKSSAAKCPSVSYTWRKNTDPAGFFDVPADAFVSAGFYDSFVAGAKDRWGDYAAIVRDPSAPTLCFWGAHEYAFTSVVGGSAWGTKIFSFCTATKGACCFGPNICANLTPADCATAGGSFRGLGSKCPTQGVVAGFHHGVSTVHWALGAINCNKIVPAAFPAGGGPGDPDHSLRGLVGGADFCQNAQAISGTGQFPFDNTNATLDGLPHSACAEFGNPNFDHDVWFTWTSQCDTQVTVDTCGQTAVDTKIAVYHAAPCPPSDSALVACNDDYPGCDLQSQLSFSALAAQPYLIRIATYPFSVGGTGTFRIATSQPCGGGCQSVDAWATSDSPSQQTCDQFGTSETPPIPPGFFYPGSNPFFGQVCYRGQPLGDTPFGTFEVADTLVRRPAGDPFDRCIAPGFEIDIPIEIVALNLVSVQPIVITGPQSPQQWNVQVGLSNFPAPQGQMTVRKTHCNGGTWDSVLPVQAKFTFTNVQNPSDIRILDTGDFGFPPVILHVDPTDNMPWVHDLDPNLHLEGPACTNFHPGIQDPNPSTDCDCNINGIVDSCDIDPNDPDGNGSVSPDCDHNSLPDECDPDLDLDGVPDACDNCKNAFNPSQTDTDGDGRGDVCDPCPLLGLIETDQDGDNKADDFDNCPCIANNNQADADGDGLGDVCDPCPATRTGDVNGDTQVNLGDVGPFVNAVLAGGGGSCLAADTNHDNQLNGLDIRGEILCILAGGCP